MDIELHPKPLFCIVRMSLCVCVCVWKNASANAGIYTALDDTTAYNFYARNIFQNESSSCLALVFFFFLVLSGVAACPNITFFLYYVFRIHNFNNLIFSASMFVACRSCVVAHSPIGENSNIESLYSMQCKLFHSKLQIIYMIYVVCAHVMLDVHRACNPQSTSAPPKGCRNNFKSKSNNV